jgi:hypothetical protein
MENHPAKEAQLRAIRVVTQVPAVPIAPTT